MIKINSDLKPSDLNSKLKRFWQLSGEKIQLIENNYDASKGSPVFTMQRQIHHQGVDRMDTGISIRVDDSSI